uniref:histone acetyltransferase n=1 Tax=Globodera rostochiensis TaxID=31243 RepID=A0A914IAR0_GLORO
MPFVTPSTSAKGHFGISSRRASCSDVDQHSSRKCSPAKNYAVDNHNEPSRPRGELKGLQDSLSQYFTPNEVRRSRVTTNRLATEQPLEILVEPGNVAFREHRTNSLCSSKSGNSTISPKSPHRRDRLEDALSPYFTPNPNKRRTHREGEYLQLSKGEDHSSTNLPKEAELDPINCTTSSGFDDRQEEKNDLESHSALSTAKLSGRISRCSHLNNRSISDNRLQKRVAEYKKKRENVGARKSAQLIRRAFKGKCGHGQLRMKMSQPVSSTLKSCNASTSLKNSIKSYFLPIKKVPSAQSSENKIIDFSVDIDEEDRLLFEEARQAIQKDLDYTNNALKNNEEKAFPQRIQINCYEIDTWYSSPYPQEYSCLPVLHICDSCLLYVSVPESHYKKCKRIFPPGIEIYREGHLSVFEVDGNLARVFCRNLCLLAKLFIDHKTLYFDVEPFLFYVLTLHDETGCHFVGYFSKEKYSCQKYNLACIVTLPCYQGMGFGRFLIEFSYLLSRRENLIGSPERPLSELGKITYHSYWLSVIYEFLYKTFLLTPNGTSKLNQISLEDISKATGVTVSDIAETLAENRLLSNKDATSSLILEENVIRAYCERSKSKKRYVLDETKLKWSPKVYTPSKDFRFRSPVLSVNSAVNSPVKKKALEDEKIEAVQPFKNKNKKTMARRNLFNSEKVEKCAPQKAAAGKIGRKKMPNGKGFPEESSNCLTNTEEEEADGEEEAPFTRKNRKKASCKETIEKKVNRREPSTDEDEEKSPGASSRLRQSTSNGTFNGETVDLQNNPRGSSMKKCVVSNPNKNLKLSEVTDICSKKNEAEEKSTRKSKKKWTSESESDSATSVTEKTSKKRKVWRRSRIFEKQQRKLSRCPIPCNSSSSPSTSASSFVERFEKRRIEVEENLANSFSSKRQKKIGQQQQEDSPNDDEDDRSYCCSSTSPQPIGDRLPILKTSIREHDLMINMGGEPDTVNMGGEPYDEAENAANTSSFSAEDEDEEPPFVVIDASQRQIKQQRSQAEEIVTFGKVQVVGGVEAMQISESFHPLANRTLKVPSVHGEPHKSSCSPSDAATVEMPALDAAEKHASSPEGSASRFGEELSGTTMLMEDDAPPMLSPQAANMTSNEPSTTTASNNNNADGDNVKIDEQRYEIEPTSTSAEELHKISNSAYKNTTSSSVSSLDISDERERKKNTQPTKEGTDVQNRNNVTRMMAGENRAICSTTTDKDPGQHESVETERESSSHGLPYIDQNISAAAVVQHTGTSIISPPPLEGHQIVGRQPTTQLNYTNVQQIDSLAAFNGVLYNQQQNYAVTQPVVQAQHPSTTQPKFKEKQSKKPKEKLSKGTSPDKTQKSIVPKHYQPNPSNLPSTSAISQPMTPTSFPPQWLNNAQQMAQHFAQYYQHQYYGATSARPADVASTMTAATAHMSMGYAAAPYFYNQWHQAWQMSAAAAGAAKFPGTAAGYPTGYEEFFNGMAMVGSANATMAGVSSSSVLTPTTPVVPSSTSVYPWPAPMFAAAAQMRHPNPASTTVSHQHFYPPSHPPM